MSIENQRNVAGERFEGELIKTYALVETKKKCDFLINLGDAMHDYEENKKENKVWWNRVKGAIGDCGVKDK